MKPGGDLAIEGRSPAVYRLSAARALTVADKRSELERLASAKVPGAVTRQRSAMNASWFSLTESRVKT